MSCCAVSRQLELRSRPPAYPSPSPGGATAPRTMVSRRAAAGVVVDPSGVCKKGKVVDPHIDHHRACLECLLGWVGIEKGQRRSVASSW